MRVIDPGHVFELACLDVPSGQTMTHQIAFVKREGDGYPGNVGHFPGTNLQEVLRALISRVKYLDNQIPHHNNRLIVMSFRHALWMLEQRAAERHGRPFLLSAMGVVRYEDSSIEDAPVCDICGHVGGPHGEHYLLGGAQAKQFIADLRGMDEDARRKNYAEAEAHAAGGCDAPNIAIASDGLMYCAHCAWNDPKAPA